MGLGPMCIVLPLFLFQMQFKKTAVVLFSLHHCISNILIEVTSSLGHVSLSHEKLMQDLSEWAGHLATVLRLGAGFNYLDHCVVPHWVNSFYTCMNNFESTGNMNLGGQRGGLWGTFIGCLLNTHPPFFPFLTLSRFSCEELPLHCVVAIENGVGWFETIQIILPHTPTFGILIGSGNSGLSHSG